MKVFTALVAFLIFIPFCLGGSFSLPSDAVFVQGSCVPDPSICSIGDCAFGIGMDSSFEATNGIRVFFNKDAVGDFTLNLPQDFGFMSQVASGATRNGKVR